LSPFFDENGVKATDLDDILKEKGITELFLIGLMTEFDIRKTALDGLKLGYRVTVFSEGCCGFLKEENELKKVFLEIEDAGGKVV